MHEVCMGVRMRSYIMQLRLLIVQAAHPTPNIQDPTLGASDCPAPNQRGLNTQVDLYIGSRMCTHLSSKICINF
jgi:hypothetical protein